MAKKICGYWSASQVGQFLWCAVSYKFLYIDGLKVFSDNIYTVYGSAIHSALAHNYQQKITSRVDLPAENVTNFFLQDFLKRCEKLKLLTSPQYEEFKIIGKLALEKYLLEIAPKIQPIAVEQKFEIKLKHYPITILGYIDVIDENGVIIDHKTAGKTYKRDWTISRAQKDIQGTLYAGAFRKLYSKREAGVRFDIIPRTLKPDFLQLFTPRSDEQVRNLFEMIFLIEKVVDIGVFLPNLSNCKTCPLASKCQQLPIIPK